MCAVLLGAIAGCLTLVAGCQAPVPAIAAADPMARAECPARLRNQVRIWASVSPLSLPDRTAPHDSHRPEELLARRLLIAASPAHGVEGSRVLASTLTITVVGGSFGGSAGTAEDGSAKQRDVRTATRPALLQEVARDRALEVIPGQLRVAPFLFPARLRAQTLALDVTVLPGGIARSKRIAALAPLWTPDRQPVAPDALEISVAAEQHLTVYSEVEAHISLDVDGIDGGTSRDIWRCTYENRFTLVDHDAVLPALWDLRLGASDGKPPRSLALFEPSVGPLRAIFSDPAAAQAFVTWLRATGATRAGRYQLGLFEADRSTDGTTIPQDRDIARTFRAASVEELKLLAVRRLGED
jgi:hypothetical protein